MYAVLHLPQFALQAILRHEPAEWARPVVLADPAADTPRVIDLTGPARDAGVTVGQTPPQAMARSREVVVRHRSPRVEAVATDAVLQAAFAFSPHLELTSPGMVTLDLRGLIELREVATDSDDGTRLLAWGARLEAAVAALGLRVRIGLAATPGVAAHAARWPVTEGPGIRVAGPVAVVREAAAFVSALPVAALEPTRHVAEIVAQWGIQNVGSLLALGQAELAERLGLEALGLFAAAAVQGCRPLRLTRPTDRFEEQVELGHTVETLEPLLFVLSRQVESLANRLEASGWVAEVLVLRLQLESGATWEQRLTVPQPTRRAEILSRMLETHLEGVRTEAPITGVGLLAEPARPVQRQFGLFEAALKDPHQFQETLARLSALVGADRVGSPVRGAGHRPDTFRLQPPDFENAPPAGRPAVDLARRTPWRRLRPALPATVNLRVTVAAPPRPIPSKPTPASPTMPPDDKVIPFPGLNGVTAVARAVAEGLPPTTAPTEGQSPVPPGKPAPEGVRCAVGSGRVMAVSGPWEASGRWWEPEAWERAEWDVAVRGGVVLRLVESGGSWTVEGVAD